MGTPGTPVFLSFFFFLNSKCFGGHLWNPCLKLTTHVLCVISVKQGEMAPGSLSFSVKPSLGLHEGSTGQHSGLS